MNIHEALRIFSPIEYQDLKSHFLFLFLIPNELINSDYND